ncbi:MAG TPA: hypothetical protein VFA94_12865, partial [Acidimicrobiales bacterium]|nr:hypothetical protein [Acidimicrobiales bacterium]
MVAIAHTGSEAQVRASARWHLEQWELEQQAFAARGADRRRRAVRSLDRKGHEEWQRSRRAARRAVIVRRRR